MQTQRLGNTDLVLSRVGLGTWAMGGGDWKFSWGPQDDQASIAAIHRGLDLGINWIDTAPAYGLGHCEEVVGRALKGLAARPIIATKCGRSWGDDRQIFPRLKRASIQAELDASLKRIGVEQFDLYQIHWPQPDEDIEEAWATVADFVKQGKVRYAGVSNFSVAQLERLRPIHPIASLQPPYSMILRGVEQELLPYCAAHQIGVVAYSPMQKGLLTGKMDRARIQALPADDHRRHDVQFQDPKLAANLQLVEQLRGLADRHHKTLAQVAIAWVLRRPEVTAAIVGVRKPEQVEDTAAAGNWQLPADDIARIDAWLANVG